MAEHVTFFKMKAQPGKVDALTEMMRGWEDERRRAADLGWVQTVVGSRKGSPDEVWAAVVWDNTANYTKNAESPQQDAWYQKMRALLTSDPEWFDCDVVDESRA